MPPPCLPGSTPGVGVRRLGNSCSQAVTADAPSVGEPTTTSGRPAVTPWQYRMIAACGAPTSAPWTSAVACCAGVRFGPSLQMARVALAVPAQTNEAGVGGDEAVSAGCMAPQPVA